MHLLADRQDLAFERVLIGQILALADDRLANQRHLREHRLADAGGVDRHIAPADHVLAFLGDETLEMGCGKFRLCRVCREEAHGHGIVADGWQDQIFRIRPVAQQCVGNLQQYPGTVAEQRVRSDRAAVVDIDQNFQTALDRQMRLLALDIRDKTDAAGVMFVV